MWQVANTSKCPRAPSPSQAQQLWLLYVVRTLDVVQPIHHLQRFKCCVHGIRWQHTCGIRLHFRGIGCIMIRLQSRWIPPVSQSSSPDAQSRQWKLTRQVQVTNENIHHTSAERQCVGLKILKLGFLLLPYCPLILIHEDIWNKLMMYQRSHRCPPRPTSWNSQVAPFKRASAEACTKMARPILRLRSWMVMDGSGSSWDIVWSSMIIVI